MGSSHSWSVGLPIQDEAMDAARSAPQLAHYHADVIYLLKGGEGAYTMSHTACLLGIRSKCPGSLSS